MTMFCNSMPISSEIMRERGYSGFAVPPEQTTARPNSAIDHEMSELAQRLELLHSRIGDLANKLLPILRQDPPANALIELKATAPDVALCPHGEKLRSLRAKLTNCFDDIESLILRAEI